MLQMHESRNIYYKSHKIMSIKFTTNSRLKNNFFNSKTFKALNELIKFDHFKVFNATYRPLQMHITNVLTLHHVQLTVMICKEAGKWSRVVTPAVA